jgi:trk system potassium uptake protein
MYVIIVGCGRVGSELANILQKEKHNVVVIDKDPKSFKRLGSNFNGITLAGNG